MGNVSSIVKDAFQNEILYKKPNLRRYDRIPAAELLTIASWARDLDKRERRLERFRKKREAIRSESAKRKIERFSVSRSFYEPESDTPWECTNILGAGAFGVVGLWQRLDARGRSCDSIAIKQINDDSSARVVKCDNYSVPMEALCMYELGDCPTICQLRDLKYFRGDDAQWRMYLEYMPNGSIKNMVQTYRDYNDEHPGDEQHIPEAYIWWVWHGLAKALQSMNKRGMLKQMLKQPPDKKNWVLHLDIKDENVLLGKSPECRELDGYPIVKVCDWGLGMATSKHDPKNSSYYKGCGTICWYPPEQFVKRSAKRGYVGLGRDWRDNIWRSNKPYTHAHACWQFAAIIYGMADLDADNETLYRMMYDGFEEERMWVNNGYKLYVMRKGSDMARTYSKELLMLLEECLQLRPEKRPDPDRLLKKTLEGGQRAADRAEAKGLDRGPYVVYGRYGVQDLSRIRRTQRVAAKVGLVV